MATPNKPGNFGWAFDPCITTMALAANMRFTKLKQELSLNNNGEDEAEVIDIGLAPGGAGATNVAVEAGCVGVVGEGGVVVRRSRRIRDRRAEQGEEVGQSEVVVWDVVKLCEDKARVVERARELKAIERMEGLRMKDEDESEGDRCVEIGVQGDMGGAGVEQGVGIGVQYVDVGVQCVDVGVQCDGVPEKDQGVDVGVQCEIHTPMVKVDVGVQCMMEDAEGVIDVSEAVRSGVRKWSYNERRVLWEIYERSIVSGMSGFTNRVWEEWRRRGLREVTKAALLAQLREVKGGRLGELEREQIGREVREQNVSDVTEENGSEERPVQGNEERTTEPRGNDESSVNAAGEADIDASESGSLSREDFWKEGNAVRTELDTDMRDVLIRLREVFEKDEIGQVPSLKSRNRVGVNREVRLVNGMIHNIEVRSVTEVNKLLHAGAFVVAERLGLMKPRRGVREQRNEPWWKRRIEGNIKRWRADLSRVEEVLRGKLMNSKAKERLDRVYGLTARGALGVRVTLRSKIQAGSTKIQRYLERNLQFHQNNLFKNNQSNLYKELSGSGRGENTAPDAADAISFWSGIWSERSEHKRDAEWIERVRAKLEGTEQQADVSVGVEDVVAGVRRMPCWKAPGPDGVRGFWFKKFSNLHQVIAGNLQECLDGGDVPEWMVTGRTVLIQKDSAKGNVASNYRPLACLPLMWKLLTGIFAEKVYDHLKDKNLLPAEQKGCRKQSRGTKDQLLIDKAVMLQARNRNLAMAWVDYKKAYDMVPHSWLLEVTEMMGVAGNVRGMMEKSMEKWQTELSVNGEILGSVDIKRGIFQGDSFSPLLFVMIMIPLSMILQDLNKGFKFGNNGEKINHLLFMDDLKLYANSENDLNVLVNEVYAYSKDISMEMGMEKCATLITRKGKRERSDGVELPSGEVMKDVSEEGYKYLGVLQNESMMNRVMKARIKEEYLRRVKLLAKSKLYARNLIDGINCWAIGVVRYSGGILDWTKGELRQMDVKTRKILTMCGVFNRKSGVGRMYLKRKDGGRGLISVADCVEGEKRSLCEYVRNSDEWMLKVVAESSLVSEVESKTVYEKRVETLRKEDMEQKSIHGRFFRGVKQVASERSYDWLKSGYLGKATESYICAAQEESLETRWRKARIYGEDVDPKCRLCGKFDETVMHLASGCGELAKRKYLIRHDGMGKRVHWELCRKYEIECAERWYEHEPESVVVNSSGEVEIYWNRTIWTAKHLDHNRPDVVVVDKKVGKWTFVDFAVPMDVNVVKKEDEKLDHYDKLAQEIRRMHRVRTEIIPIVIGALGTVPKRLEEYLRRLGVPDVIGAMQKAALLGTQRILKNVLCI